MELKLIMIVDDDADDRLFFIDALQKLNKDNKHIAAVNGKDALSQLRELSILPDFIFLDLNMPVMSGVEFLGEIKKDARLCTIPVIVYTTSISPEHHKQTSELGAKYYLPKTSALEKLPTKIKFAIELLDTLLEKSDD